MTVHVGRRAVPLRVSVYFAGMVTLCIIAAPVRQIALGLVFAALHELGHLAAMAVFRAPAQCICLTAAGVRIERAPGLSLGFSQEIIIAFAGPAVSLALAGFFGALQFCILHCHFSFITDCAAINLGFGLFNLLPVRQLDGGRALYFALCRRVNEAAAEQICLAVSLGCLFFVGVGAALLCLRGGVKLTLIVAVVYLAVCC